MEIREVGKNMFTFCFLERRDKDQILRGYQWSFEWKLIVLNELEKEVNPKEVSLTHSLFWIQIHELPLGIPNREDGMAIGLLHWKIHYVG